MQGLHAGDHAEFAEARDVRGGCVLDVLDAVAGIFGSVYGRGIFVGVEGGANGAIADGVGEDLNSPAVELSHKILVLLGFPQ